MIALSLPEWLLVVLFVHLAAVFAITLYYFLRRIAARPRHAGTPAFFRCRGCGHVYVDHRNVPMAECEKCGTMNDSIRSA